MNSVIEKKRAAMDIIEEAFNGFDNLLIASSLQKESSVIIDLALRVNPDATFFTINTGNPFAETLQVQKDLEDYYGIKINTYYAVDYAPIDILVQANIDNVWAGDPEECCGKYKVSAFKDVIKNADAWMTGLRRDQTETRKNTESIGWDDKNNLWKVCPIVDWTEEDVWNYIYSNNIPYNKLHDEGYESIGCKTCTIPGHGRAGRWAGSNKTECGINA